MLCGVVRWREDAAKWAPSERGASCVQAMGAICGRDGSSGVSGEQIEMRGEASGSAYRDCHGGLELMRGCWLRRYSGSGMVSISSSSLSEDCVAKDAGERRVGRVGMASGCAMAIPLGRSRAKLGEVGEFCGVLRRTYEEMGV